MSVGRPYYGACRVKDINRANEAQHIALGWPVPVMPDDGGLVGAFTVPTMSAVSGALNFLAERADRQTGDSTLTGIVKQINAVSDWLGMVWALGFALRKWTQYSVAREGIEAGAALVDDKDAHDVKGVPLPVIALVQHTLQAWDGFVLDAADRLRRLGLDAALVLADKIERAQRSGVEGCPIFQVRGDGELSAVGYLGWHEAVPSRIRLVPNFARQFWSYHLLLKGVVQVVADVLMRHQIADLHAGSTAHSMCVRSVHDALLQAMERVIEQLNLLVPVALQR